MTRPSAGKCICPVCGSVKWSDRYNINEWNIQECDCCHFAKIDPMPLPQTRVECYSKEMIIERNVKQKNILQKLSRILKRSLSRITKREKSAIFYNKLHRHLKPGSKVLDIGCGDGSFMKLAKKDFKCTGIEISEHLASLARKDNEIRVITGNFTDIDLGKEKYDGITMISILEHLYNPLEALKICFGALNSAGVLILKTVNYSCLNRKIKKVGWTGFRPPDHVVYFNPGNLRRMLKKTGFSKIKVHSMPFSDNMYCEAYR